MVRSLLRTLTRYHTTEPDLPGYAFFKEKFQDYPRRSYLYVPASSERMLQKSLTSHADTIIYDLEDSVAPDKKDKARNTLMDFLQQSQNLPHGSRLSVRVNAFHTMHWRNDISALDRLPCQKLSAVVLPKVHDQQPFEYLVNNFSTKRPWNIIASIESAKSLYHMDDVLKFKHHRIKLEALLFAAEDYCASSSIQRSPSRLELLYPRQRIVTCASAYGLHAIDMVNINYQDNAYHKEECEEGRKFGFNGKQAIHPSQIAAINEAFRPSNRDVLRATQIVRASRRFHKAGAGAFGLEKEDGSKEMIDAPMLKQAKATLKLAELSGLKVEVEE